MRNIFLMLTVVLAIGIAAFSQSASALDRSQTTLGARGDRITVVECPAGEVLKGFQGRKGAAIDQIQVLCAPVLVDGTTGPAHPFRDAYGGFGGGDAPAVACGPQTRIASAHVVLTPSADMVAGIQLFCVDQNNRFVNRASFAGSDMWPSGTTVDRINAKFIPTRYGAMKDYACPDESFIGVRIRYDNAVRGIGFHCDVRTPPAPPPPVQAAPPPAPRNPTEGNRPIKTTGKVRGAGEPAPALGPLDFSGDFSVIVDHNKVYDMILVQDDEGAVTGRLTSTSDPTRSGKLEGVVDFDKKVLDFTFSRKDGLTIEATMKRYSAKMLGATIKTAAGDVLWAILRK